MKRYVLLMSIVCLTQAILSMNRERVATGTDSAHKRIKSTPDAAVFGLIGAHTQKNGNTYTCTYNECGQGLESAALWQHMQEHIFSPAIHCPGCHKNMEDGPALVTHIEDDHCPIVHAIIIKEGERVYFCRQCLTYVTHYEDIAPHVKTHRNNTPSVAQQSASFSCQYCKKIFPKRENLHSHEKNIGGRCRHIVSTGNQFACTLCKNITFISWHGAMMHCTTHRQDVSEAATSDELVGNIGEPGTCPQV